MKNHTALIKMKMLKHCKQNSSNNKCITNKVGMRFLKQGYNSAIGKKLRNYSLQSSVTFSKMAKKHHGDVPVDVQRNVKQVQQQNLTLQTTNNSKKILPSTIFNQAPGICALMLVPL